MRICATCEQAIGNAKLFAAAITAAVIDAPCCHRALHRLSTVRADVYVQSWRCCVRPDSKAAGSMSGQCPFWDLLLAWKFVLLRVFPEFPCECPLGLLRAGGGFRVGASGPGVDSCDEQDGKRRQRLCMRCILVCRLEYIHDLVAKL